MQISISDVGNHLQVRVEADQLAASLPTARQRSSLEKNLYIGHLHPHVSLIQYACIEGVICLEMFDTTSTLSGATKP
jgi:hypothetical protein